MSKIYYRQPVTKFKKMEFIFFDSRYDFSSPKYTCIPILNKIYYKQLVTQNEYLQNGITCGIEIGLKLKLS